MQAYDTFAPILRKARGRYRERIYAESPRIWVEHLGEGQPVRFHCESVNPRVHVATLFPDNAYTINIRGWHTQFSCRIIGALAPVRAHLHKGRIWIGGAPICGDVIQYDTAHRRVMPEAVTTTVDKVRAQLALVTRETFSPKARLQLELGSWSPRATVTSAVVAFALGRCELSELSQRDIHTCLTAPDTILTRCLEEIA